LGGGGSLTLMRLPSLAVIAVLCGAVLMGWALGGVASVDQRLQAVSPQPQRFIVDHHGCHHRERL
jgi:hypothetical protein